MFSHPRPNVIKSEEGFEVELFGRAGMKYAEEGKEYYINSELTTSGIGIYLKYTRFWEQRDKDTVSQAEKERIINNIKRALAYCGLNVDVDYA